METNGFYYFVKKKKKKKKKKSDESRISQTGTTYSEGEVNLSFYEFFHKTHENVEDQNTNYLHEFYEKFQTKG